MEEAMLYFLAFASAEQERRLGDKGDRAKLREDMRTSAEHRGRPFERGVSGNRAGQAQGRAESRIADGRGPHRQRRRCDYILLMFQAMTTRLHSPRTQANPRNRKRRKPITALMMPNTGVCLRRLQQKSAKEPLAEFIKRKGGINECNARYGRCSGDSPRGGNQSGLFSAERQASERRCSQDFFTADGCEVFGTRYPKTV
jgi:hypothetical protein